VTNAKHTREDENYFRFQIDEYRRGLVVRLLENYVDMRGTVLGGLGKPMKTTYKQTVKYTYDEKPLGASDYTPWPFMHKPHAQSPPNGRQRASMYEEMECALIDIEDALNALGDEDFKLVFDYYIVGGRTLDQLAAERGLTSRGRLYERIQRIVKRMVKHMNKNIPEDVLT
jgi:hypothetical protein